MRNFKIYVTLFAVLGMLFSSCNTSRTTRGGAIGAGAGGVLGGVIGNRAGNTAAGAIIGAAVGGATGAVIGRHMDKQAEELQRDLKNARVERVGEGIKITFNSGILFATNSAQVQSNAQTELTQLAQTLKKYEDTNILVEGHTDNTGGRDLNQRLSEQRAESVANFLSNQGVSRSRMTSQGYAFDQPVGDNSTEAGRQQNRRVEIAIYANEKMKKAAERGDL
ncbi:OmpA family protein [Pontibacter sp. 13R65]|uniref:OmpA family protein n=1 Tax=Pontibacter sp. 13R65 TaxID=3127458 RepID=UPI00301DABC1